LTTTAATPPRCRSSAATMPPKAKDDQSQLTLAFITPTKLVRQGDGSYVVTQGKPVARLTIKQFATEVGLERDTIYGYLGTEAIPAEFVDYSGKRKILISAAAVEHWKEHWKNLRLYGVSPAPVAK
jgi:hypothetical protein